MAAKFNGGVAGANTNSIKKEEGLGRFIQGPFNFIHHVEGRHHLVAIGVEFNQGMGTEARALDDS